MSEETLRAQKAYEVMKIILQTRKFCDGMTFDDLVEKSYGIVDAMMRARKTLEAVKENG